MRVLVRVMVLMRWWRAVAVCVQLVLLCCALPVMLYCS
jgi:hypothetical protein